MDMRKNLKEEYLRQSIMTASPAELTVMLFNGCIKDLRLAEVAMEEPADLLKVNEYLIKAQKILSELMGSLDLSYELSGQLLPIYSYLLREIRHMYCCLSAEKAKAVSRIPRNMRIQGF